MAASTSVHTHFVAPPFSPAPAALCLDQETWLAGPSAAMAQLRGQFRRVAPYFRTALLTGERGCGEVLAARVLHQMSPLKDRAFVVLTPSAAELRFARNSLAPAALDGMIFLPQPERLSRLAQVAILRLLREHGQYAPRIVAFAERGLRSIVSAGGFSADLAEALTALRITMPSLRDRAEDIPSLLSHMLQLLATERGTPTPRPPADLLEAAVRQSWPGNLAQLHTAAIGLIARSGKGELRPEDLTAVLSSIAPAVPRERRETRMLRLDDVIQEHIRAVLSACNGNKLRTAEVLGISRSTLYRMLDATGHAASIPLHADKFQMAR
ncbi:MAG: sigma-54-dependent Fis family transcriptional regulator [Acidobacteria bacterium]|nr:sigma-54-dependent Fis family transcriptional regulator [Acidobacteriota bacterium]